MFEAGHQHASSLATKNQARTTSTTPKHPRDGGQRKSRQSHKRNGIHLFCEEDTPNGCGTNAATEASSTRSNRIVFMVALMWSSRNFFVMAPGRKEGGLIIHHIIDSYSYLKNAFCPKCVLGATHHTRAITLLL